MIDFVAVLVYARLLCPVLLNQMLVCNFCTWSSYRLETSRHSVYERGKREMGSCVSCVNRCVYIYIYLYVVPLPPTVPTSCQFLLFSYVVVAPGGSSIRSSIQAESGRFKPEAESFYTVFILLIVLFLGSPFFLQSPTTWS